MKKVICPGSNRPTAAKMLPGSSKVYTVCASCRRFFHSQAVGSRAPRHYLGTIAHG